MTPTMTPALSPPTALMPALQGMDPDQRQRMLEPIEALIYDRIIGSPEPERFYQIDQLLRNDRFWKGFHYHVPQLRGSSVEWVDVRNASITEDRQREYYDYVLNFYYGDGLKLVGVLGRMPNMKAMPDERNDTNNRRARKADQIIWNLWSHWGLKAMAAEVVRSLWCNSVTFLYTPFVMNKRKYGATKFAVYEDRQIQIEDAMFSCLNCGIQLPAGSPGYMGAQQTGMCPQCRVPVNPGFFMDPEFLTIQEESGSVEFENGTVELRMCTPLEVQTPFHIKSLDDSPWLQYEVDEHVGKVMQAFPDQADQIRTLWKSGNRASGNSEWASQARQMSASPNFMQHLDKDRCRFTRTWLEPEMYELLEGQLGGELRDMLMKMAPDGARISMVNGRAVHLFAESHKQCWAAIKPTVSDYLYATPLGNPYIPVQRAINNGFNITQQTAERGIPLTFFHANLLDGDALRKNGATVWDHIPVLPGVNQNLHHAFWQTTPAQLSPAVVEMGTKALDSGRQITGVLPTLYGLGGPVEKTLGQAEMENNQALQPHQATWNFMAAGFARAAENAIFQFAKHSIDNKVIFANSAQNRPREVKIDDLEELLDGGFHVECEETIPLTAGQKRAQYFQILGLQPEVVQATGILQPENLEAMYDALANGDLKIPAFKAKEKIIRQINELLEEAPIEQQVMGMDGMPTMEVMPSRPPAEFEDDHELWVRLVKEWANDDKEFRGGWHQINNPRGYTNVIVRAKAHLAIAQAQMAPPPGQLPGGVGGGPVPPPLAETMPGGPPPPGLDAVGPAPPQQAEQPGELGAPPPAV